jgi:hypothetical protein
MSLANKEHPRTGKPHLVMRGGYWVAVERQANDCWGDVIDKALIFVMTRNADKMHAEGMRSIKAARQLVSLGDSADAKRFYKEAQGLFEEANRLRKKAAQHSRLK